MGRVVGVAISGGRGPTLRAMGGAPQNHVINDLVAGVPLTVTLCDLGRCVRVFTHTGSEPLDISVAGMRNDDMMLKVEGRLFSQKSGQSLDPEHSDSFPFDEAAYELTTWEKWREAHPDTDVSVGTEAP